VEHSHIVPCNSEFFRDRTMIFHIAAIIVVLAQVVLADEGAPLEFNRDIRPILSENCFHCHGADAAQRQAELRLDVREAALELGAIAPGQVDESSVVERITSGDADLKMPPPDSERELTVEQIETLKRWIAEGAEYQPHWAFLPVRQPELPSVDRHDWPRNGVDRFVLAKLEQEGAAPSKRAPLPALLRRISFDLTGLPPTPAQLTTWQAAAGPVDAALDELLASPHYGERMAVDWLDVARYADTHGFNNDTLRTMWRWRDWVVDAFNANLPYDRFITTQLAGDLLADATLDDRIATGFNRNHVINSEGGIIDEEYRVEYVADRVRTMSLAWLGLTLECARCHDHKFDPISQREYYQMFAFFNSVDETGEDGRVANAAPLMPAPTRDQQRRYEELLERERATEVPLKELATVAADSQSERQSTAPSSTAPPLEKLLALTAADEPLKLPGASPIQAELAALKLTEGWAFLGWVKRDAATAGPLVSTMNFSAPPSSQGYGAGMQIGLTGEGAVDVRLAIRWPAYALNVRSVDMIPTGKWRHVAVVGHGNKSEGFRIFIDGVEVQTEIRHDDLTGNVGVGGSASVGRSGEPSNNAFEGELHRLRIISGTLGEEQLETLLSHELFTAEEARGSFDATWEQQLMRATVQKGFAESPLAKPYADWKTARRERLAFLRTFPTLMVMRDLPQPREAFVLDRGQYDKPTDSVSPDVPEVFGLPLPEGVPADRVALAQWLTDPRHPLTARVVVNRYWQSLFGVGLVKTVEDFGVQGEWPSHPELLDWLAAEFVASGWDVKQLVRLMVTSATYQQDSSAAANAWANDPENRLLARGPRQRLTAEMIRDQALSVSSLLVPRLGGPPVFPYQPADLYKGIVVEAGYPGTTYQQSTGEDLYRRSVYTFWKRTVPHPTLSTFDAPDREFCTARRSVTSTPLQALVLMNDPTFLEAARRLGERMLEEGGDGDEARIAWAFKLVTAREPTGDELAKLAGLLKGQRDEFSAEPGAPKGLLHVGDSEPAATHADKELAAYASIASLLLNLDEALTRN
jgi:hypothetical protein